MPDLLDLGADLSFHDPYVTEWFACPEVPRSTDLADAVATADLTILVEHHRDFDLADLVGRARLFLTPGGRRTTLAPSASMGRPGTGGTGLGSRG